MNDEEIRKEFDNRKKNTTEDDLHEALENEGMILEKSKKGA